MLHAEQPLRTVLLYKAYRVKEVPTDHAWAKKAN
jgi:hypothetical protein